jgi:hypothetical protein
MGSCAKMNDANAEDAISFKFLSFKVAGLAAFLV